MQSAKCKIKREEGTSTRNKDMGEHRMREIDVVPTVGAEEFARKRQDFLKICVRIRAQD